MAPSRSTSRTRRSRENRRRTGRPNPDPTLENYKARFRDITNTALYPFGHGLTYGKIESALGGTVRQKIDLQQGIPQEKAKEIVKIIKDHKFKVQASIQGDYVRVAGKDRDTLQEVISLLREKDFGIDMQFTNYRSN